ECLRVDAQVARRESLEVQPQHSHVGSQLGRTDPERGEAERGIVVDVLHESQSTSCHARLSRSVGGPEQSGPAYSHSIVPGGLLVTSRTTRLTSRTSFVMRFETFASSS